MFPFPLHVKLSWCSNYPVYIVQTAYLLTYKFLERSPLTMAIIWWVYGLVHSI